MIGSSSGSVCTDGRGLITSLMNLLRQCCMCPPLAANCQVTGEFPVLIMPTLVLRVPCLSITKFVITNCSCWLGVKLNCWWFPHVAKSFWKQKKKKLPCCLCYNIYGISFKKKTSDFKEVFELSYKISLLNSGCHAKKQMAAVQNEL